MFRRVVKQISGVMFGRRDTLSAVFVLDVLFGAVFIEGVNGSEFPPGPGFQIWLGDCCWELATLLTLLTDMRCPRRPEANFIL